MADRLGEESGIPFLNRLPTSSPCPARYLPSGPWDLVPLRAEHLGARQSRFNPLFCFILFCFLFFVSFAFFFFFLFHSCAWLIPLLFLEVGLVIHRLLTATKL